LVVFVRLFCDLSHQLESLHEVFFVVFLVLLVSPPFVIFLLKLFLIVLKLLRQFFIQVVSIIQKALFRLVSNVLDFIVNCL